MSSGRACSDDGDRPLWVQEQLLLSARTSREVAVLKPDAWLGLMG